MEGFSGYKYLQYAEEGSPETESGSSNSPTGDIMLAEYHPKKPAGRKKFKETRHPVYRGIRQRNSGKWVCEVREPNKTTRIWLGTYSTAEMATRAHDVAAIALRGRNACLNFADSLWRLPVPESGETKDIQRAAAEAAEAFQPRSTASEAEPASAPSGVEGKMDDGVAFMAEEEWFEMPEIIADMYNGMMLPPPEHTYVADDFSEYDVDVDLPLWSY